MKLIVGSANHKKKIEGVCVNYRNPDPRRGEPRVGSAPDVAFPVDPEDPLDPLENSVRLSNAVFYNDFGTFCQNCGPIFCPKPLKTMLL